MVPGTGIDIFPLRVTTGHGRKDLLENRRNKMSVSAWRSTGWLWGSCMLGFLKPREDPLTLD